ncbi:MAG: protein kinase, partial [Acidobacteriota bacterium]|nr:protein kinase [Acidobacteriota bacterium]
MNPERWQKVEEVFETSIELPAEEREAFLTRACDGDTELRTEVASLLANEVEETFFQSAVADGAKTFARATVEEMIGQRIGVYRLTSLVGQGGMGAVYGAVRDDDQFNQQVAIKVIKRGMDTSLVLRRFWRERQILASLNHPNIARLLDGGTTPDGRPYFVMELVRGVAITNYCDQNRLPTRQRLDLFIKV